MTGKKGVYWASSFIGTGGTKSSRFSSTLFDVVWLSKMECIELLQGKFYMRI